MLAGYGIERITHRGQLLLLGVVLFAEYLPVPMLHWELPPTSAFHSRLAKEVPEYAVIDLPLGYTYAKLWLYHQTLHGRPMVEGHVSRYTPELYHYILTNPLLRALYQPTLDSLPRFIDASDFGEPSLPLADLGLALRDLTDHNVRYILLHGPYLDAESMSYLRQVLPLIPVYRDATLTVYDLRRPIAAYYENMPCALTSDSSLAKIVIEPAENDDTWHISILADATREGTSNVSCEIRLEGAGGRVVATVPFTLFATPTDGREWHAGDLVPWVSAPNVGQKLTPGYYTWVLSCEDNHPCQSPDTLYVDDTGTTTYTRRSVDVDLDATVKLTGYRWSTQDGELKASLFWRALTTPAADLKTFVHLVDEQQVIRSQYDAIPCEWQCPTETWLPGETVVDRVTLDLTDLPSGNYALAVGMYEPATGNRLGAIALDGTEYDDGYILLPDAFRIHRVEP